MSAAADLRAIADMARGPLLAHLVRCAANAVEGGRVWMMRYEVSRLEGAPLYHADDLAAIVLALEVLRREMEEQ